VPVPVQVSSGKKVYSTVPVGVNSVPAGVGVTVEVSNTELPNGKGPVTGAPPASLWITVAVAVVPGLMVNGSQVLVEPA
jgi:hypothetical protein